MDNDEGYVLTLNAIPKVNEFLSLFGVTGGGLGAQLLEDVYKQFFVFSTDLKSEYKKYYSVEYPEISQYLELCHDIVLPSDDLEREYIYKFQNNCHLTNEAYDNNYLDRIISILRENYQ